MTKLRFDMATLMVPDYDAGIAFYRDVLGFDLVKDIDLGAGKRWVVVAPDGGARLLLAAATSDRQSASIGNQTGERVAFFLRTDNFDTTHGEFLAKGVQFHEQPRREAYGIVAVFSDPFGNRWDLIEGKV